MIDRENSLIQVTVKLFAIYQETFNLPELTLNIPQESTVNDVLDMLIKKKPQLEQWQEVTRFGVNLKFVEADTIVREGDEIVLIPPVSGG
ncbi:MAG: MoaD/ThiS family protein [Pleurocapsa sp.]